MTQRLFETRLGIVVSMVEPRSEVRDAHADWLHEQVSGMNLDNVLVRAHRRQVERWSERHQWTSLSAEDAAEALDHLAGLPSTVRDADEDAKRFDLLVLRSELAQLEHDVVTAERLRETVQAIASALLAKLAIPSVAEQAVLLESVAGDEWWTDVTLPMLELMRRRLRGLVRFIERTTYNPIYTDFQDALEESDVVELPQVTTGMNWDRFRSRAQAYLRDHEDHVALQKVRRNRQLTHEDIDSLTAMLVDAGGEQPVDIQWVTDRAGELGPFIRSLVGLEREAATEAFARFLDGSRFTVDQVRFVSTIIDELTANGVMEPGRLFEPPYTDQGAVDVMFGDEAAVIVEILRDVRRTASPGDTGVA